MSDLVERLDQLWDAIRFGEEQAVVGGLLAELYKSIYSHDAELSRLSALVAWQDIETAPRDGTPIIGAFWTIRWADSHRRGDIVRCWYQPEFGAFISSAREMTLAPGLTFEDGTSRQIHSPVIEPVTHWMHLHPFTAAKEG